MSCTQVPGVYWNGYGISPFIWVIYTIRIGGVAALFEVPSSLVVVPVVSSFDNWGFASNFLDAGSLTGDHELLLGGQRNHPVSILNLKRGWNWYSQSVFSFQWNRNIPKPLKVEDWSNLSNWLGICVLRPPLSTSWPWHVRSMICGKENLRRRIREVLAGLGRWSHRSPWIEVHKKHETTSDYFHKMGMHIYIYTTYSYVQQYTFTCTWCSSGWSFRTLLAVHSYLQGHDSPIDQHSLRAGRSHQHRHPLDIKHLWMLKCSYPK
jgi:hypothetical protein